MSTIDDLEYFTTLAGARTLTEAARYWGVSVSIVSRRLKAIEERLGVRLVERGARGIELTPEGRIYRSRGAEILQQVIDLESLMNPNPQELSGSVRVVCTVGLGRMHVGPLLKEFQAAHPKVECALELSSLPLSASLSGFDVGIHVGRVRDSSLSMRQLLPNRRVVVASPQYLAEYGRPTTIDDLKQHNCLVVRENEGESLWRFLVSGKEVSVPVRGGLSCNDGIVVTDWCIAGAGLAMRSEWHVSQFIRSEQLVHVLPEVKTPEAHVVALFDSSRIPARVAALLDHLKAGLANRCLSDTSRVSLDGLDTGAHQ